MVKNKFFCLSDNYFFTSHTTLGISLSSSHPKHAATYSSVSTHSPGDIFKKKKKENKTKQQKQVKCLCFEGHAQTFP